MKKNKQARPVNLNLFQIKFPVTAIASISHRMSGILLFLCIPGLFWLLSQSLTSEQHFNQLATLLNTWWAKSLIWLVLSAFFYHFMGGIRHIVLDLGIGETLQAGRLTATAVIVISVIFALLLGVRLLW